jgi:mRNA interferase RelE/StbE
MKVEFLAKFSKDVDLITDQSIKDDIQATIDQVERGRPAAVPNQSSILNLKKLKGFKYADRIRIGDFRIGVYIEKGTVEFARCVHRRDIDITRTPSWAK